MIDPNFDPYQILNDLQRQTLQNASNTTKLAQAFNQRTEIIDKLIELFNEQTATISQLQQRIQQLENSNEKIQIARSYTNHPEQR
jgi:glycine cleavage system regulatory protein